MTANDVTGPLKLLQMVPLDEEGIFKVLQMVNKHGTPTAYKDETLKTNFEKWWWPDLQKRLEEMQLPEQQPEKSSRPVPEILDEILSIVRSIDKSTSRATTFMKMARSLAEIVLKMLLVPEVEKTDSVLAQLLSAATASFDGETLAITLPHLVPEHRLETAKKAADRLGRKCVFLFPGDTPPATYAPPVS
jgi:hypothetical protein